MEGDALEHERHLVDVVELRPEGTGRGRRAQRPERGTTLEDDGAQTGTRREVRRRGTDDATADDHQIGRGRQFVRALRHAHRAHTPYSGAGLSMSQ